MLMKELCRRCGLSKKAVEYYEEQGLVSPRMRENGYRDFSEADGDTLQKVALLRKLGLSVAEIRPVLGGDLSEGRDAGEGNGGGPVGEGGHAAAAVDQRALAAASAARGEAASRAGKRAELLARLARGESWETIGGELADLEAEESVLQRLQDTFPGPYGRFLRLHFAAFLGEPIRSPAQREAFDVIVDFLDGASLPALTPELQEMLAAMDLPDESLMAAQSQGLRAAAEDWESYMAENREALESYMALRESEAFRQHPDVQAALRLKETLAAFQQSSGYYDVFIPAMRRLSPRYDEYHRRLAEANEAFLAAYPQAAGRDED